MVTASWLCICQLLSSFPIHFPKIWLNFVPLWKASDSTVGSCIIFPPPLRLCTVFDVLQLLSYSVFNWTQVDICRETICKQLCGGCMFTATVTHIKFAQLTTANMFFELLSLQKHAQIFKPTYVHFGSIHWSFIFYCFSAQSRLHSAFTCFPLSTRVGWGNLCEGQTLNFVVSTLEKLWKRPCKKPQIN